MKDKPNYYAILIAEVRYDNRLSSSEKLLYAEITALSNVSGKCFATNQYFADLYGVTVKTISLQIKKLIECGHINSVINTKENRRYLSINENYPINKNVNTPLQKCNTPLYKNVNTPLYKNVIHNNTSSNNNITYSNIISDLKDLNKISLLNEWLEYRKQIKKTIKSEKTLKALVKKFNTEDVSTIDYVVNRSIDNQWQGLFWDKVPSKPKTMADEFKHWGDIPTDEQGNFIINQEKKQDEIKRLS